MRGAACCILGGSAVCWGHVSAAPWVLHHAASPCSCAASHANWRVGFLTARSIAEHLRICIRNQSGAHVRSMCSCTALPGVSCCIHFQQEMHRLRLNHQHSRTGHAAAPTKAMSFAVNLAAAAPGVACSRTTVCQILNTQLRRYFRSCLFTLHAATSPGCSCHHRSRSSLEFGTLLKVRKYALVNHGVRDYKGWSKKLGTACYWTHYLVR